MTKHEGTLRKVVYTLSLFMTGVLGNAFASLSITVAYLYLEGVDLERVLIYRTVLILLASLNAMVIKKFFYQVKELDKDSIITLIIIQGIVSYLILDTFSFLCCMLHLTFESYYLYSEEMQILNGKSILLVSSTSKALKLFVLIIIMKYYVSSGSYILTSTIVFVLLDIVVRRLIWKYKFSEVYYVKANIFKGITGLLRSVKVDSEDFANKGRSGCK